MKSFLRALYILSFDSLSKGFGGIPKWRDIAIIQKISKKVLDFYGSPIKALVAIGICLTGYIGAEVAHSHLLTLDFVSAALAVFTFFMISRLKLWLKQV